jgi:hypothetical protein
MRNKYRTIIIIAIVLIVYFFLFQKRNIYRIGKDTYVTTWKQWNGNTFVMPYKYYGLVNPKINYIRVDTRNSLGLFFVNDSIIVFSNELFDNIPVINFSKANTFYFSVNENNSMYKHYYEKTKAFIEWSKIYEEPYYSEVIESNFSNFSRAGIAY